MALQLEKTTIYNKTNKTQIISKVITGESKSKHGT
jgi:hypothetical protein